MGIAIGMNLDIPVEPLKVQHPEFLDPNFGLPKGGLSVDQPLIETPVGADRWALSKNDFTQMLGIAPGRDGTQDAMQKVWQDPDQPFSARGVAFTLDTALKTRDIVAGITLVPAHKLGSMALNLGEWALNKVIPDGESPKQGLLTRALVSADDALTRAVTNFSETSADEKRKAVVDGANAFGNAYTASVRNAWNDGRPGLALGEGATLALAGPAAYLKLSGLFNSGMRGVNNGLQTLRQEITASSAVEAKSAPEVWPGFGPLKDTPVRGEVLNVALRPLEPNTDSLPTWRHVSIYPPQTMLPRVNGELASTTAAYNPSVYNKANFQALTNGLRNSYVVDVIDAQAVRGEAAALIESDQMSPGQALFLARRNVRGGASMVPNWQGEGAYNWAMERYGPKLDAGGQPVIEVFNGVKLPAPNVPPNTAFLGNVVATNELLGSGRQAVEIGLQGMRLLGQERLTGFTTSPYAAGRFATYDAPGTFRITDVSALPDAPDKIWNSWLREVPGVKDPLASTWSRAIAERDDITLRTVAKNIPAMHIVDETTGSSPYQRLLLSLEPLYKNNPINALNSMPVRDQLLLPENTMRIGFEWSGLQNKGFLAGARDTLSSLYRPELTSRLNAFDLRGQGFWNDASYASKRMDSSIMAP